MVEKTKDDLALQIIAAGAATDKLQVLINAFIKTYNLEVPGTPGVNLESEIFNPKSPLSEKPDGFLIARAEHWLYAMDMSKGDRSIFDWIASSAMQGYGNEDVFKELIKRFSERSETGPV